MPIDFYGHKWSPPCRTILMLGEALGIEFNYIEIDYYEKQEHLSPKFLAINPQHTLPTIVDDGLILWESRAILAYLADTYGKNDSLYPKDPQIRAQVDRLLYFDIGTLFDRMLKYGLPVMREGAKPDPANLEKLHEALGWLNGFLEGHFFAVANRITIADFALVTSIGLISAVGIDFQKYPRLSSWYTRCSQQMKGFDKINKEANELTKNMIKGKFRA